MYNNLTVHLTFQVSDDGPWYNLQPIGEHTLRARIKNFYGKDSGITPHSYRATSATILAKRKFDIADRMAFTGHRSIAGISVYNRVDSDARYEMQKACMPLTKAQPACAVSPSELPAVGQPAAAEVEEVWEDVENRSPNCAQHTQVIDLSQ